MAAPAPKLRLLTTSERVLRRRGRLRVRVRYGAFGRVRIMVRVRGGGRFGTRLIKARLLSFRRAGRKTASLRLTRFGRALLRRRLRGCEGRLRFAVLARARRYRRLPGRPLFSPRAKSPKSRWDRKVRRLRQPPCQRPLLVADLSTVSDDEQLLFTALQGLVNRRSPRVYYVGLRNGQDFAVDPTAEAWLRDAVPLPTKRVAPYDLLRRFRSEARGLVVWDPGMAVDTQNVATTMAGHHQLLPVSPALADRLGQAPYRLRVRMDLRREAFQRRGEAYEWALAHLDPSGRTGALGWLGESRNGRVGQHGLRDLIVARRGFAFDANPQDDQELVFRILDAFPRITRVFGYPFFETEFYAHTQLAENESIGVGEISRAGKVLVPSTDSTNLTVHRHLRVTPPRPTWDDRPEAPDPAKTYVSFLISDGDSLGHNQQILRPRHWDHPARGSIPMGISISPWLSVYAPRIYDFYVRTLAPSDVLLAGPSGAGYFYPQFQAQLDLHLEKTRRLMDYTGLRAVWILDNGYLASPSQAIVEQYAQALRPSAIFADYGGYVVPNPPALSFAGGVPVVHAMWVTGMDGTPDRIRLAASSFPGRPAFVLVALQTGRMSYSDAREVMERLGPSYEAVRPDRFVGLIKGVYGGASR